MPVPPRQQLPALLQVDAILVRLAGVAALEEVCRYVGAELPQFATLAVYRPEGSALRRLTHREVLADGGEAPTAPDGAAARALAERRSAITGPSAPAGAEATSEIAVLVLDGGNVTGVLLASSRFSRSFDATDARFLEQVAGKIRAVVAAVTAAGAPSA